MIFQHNQEDRGVWDCADIPGIVVWGPEGSGQWGLYCILYQVGQAGTIIKSQPSQKGFGHIGRSEVRILDVVDRT